MTRQVSCSLDDLGSCIAADLDKLEADVKVAMQKTAEAAVPIIQGRVPVAFGELKGSVHAEPMKTVIDAPHAGSVEVGSLPHSPDMVKLLAWVKLRGMQGLTSGGRIKSRFARDEGPTTRYQARRVARALEGKEVRGRSGKNIGSIGRHSPVDAPEQVAQAIARGIEKYGTRPHWFTRSSLPEIKKALDTEIRSALGK